MNVLIILGHPRTDSLCGALADAYGEGARAAGTDVRRLDLATLSLTYILWFGLFPLLRLAG